jgi:hypothetical protein
MQRRNNLRKCVTLHLELRTPIASASALTVMDVAYANYANAFDPLRERGRTSCARKLRKHSEEVSGLVPVYQLLS